MSQTTFSSSIVVPTRLVFLMWLTFTVEELYGISLSFLGIYPRELTGLIGIFTAPLIHDSLVHLGSNTFPILFLGPALYYFYHNVAREVFLQCYFITNLFVWILGRSSYHIGASGLIYGIASFLIFYGIFKKDMKSLLISLIVLSFYWTLIYGIFPNQPGVSWESHLFGGLVGAASAFLNSRRHK